MWEPLWKGGWIGCWQKDETNKHLKAHYRKWAAGLGAGSRVLVTLCGKTVDLMWLAEHKHTVVGIEYVPEAVTQFWEETAGVPLDEIDTRNVGAHTITTTADGPVSRINMICGDFFTLNSTGITYEVLGQNKKFDLIWDRASLVAIHPSMRQRYVEVEASLIRPGGRLLLVTYDYEKTSPDAADGPPHAVSPEQARELYGKFFEVEHLGGELLANPVFDLAASHWADMSEQVFLLTRKDP